MKHRIFSAQRKYPPPLQFSQTGPLQDSFIGGVRNLSLKNFNRTGITISVMFHFTVLMGALEFL